MKKILKPFINVYAWFKDSIVETVNQSWTLLGMFAAWLVLEGSAKDIVGYAILFTLFIWLLTIRTRD
jgi:hypothetical protein